jgi:dihydrofolate reductase
VGNIVYYMSMSLDGFVTAAGISPEEPLGAGGERLHEWGTDPEGSALLEDAIRRTGAVITGRRTYDASLPWWGSDGPTGKERIPVFVLTHREQPAPPVGGVYTFVTDGLDSTLRQAKVAAGGGDVSVSGVEVGRQLLQAGHVDEIWISLVPVLFGDGSRLYEQVGGRHLELDFVEAIPTPKATHLHYRPRKS